MRRLRFTVLGVITAISLVAACRIEDRSPDGSRRDEEAIRGVVTGYYGGVSEKSWPEARALFWDSALVQIRTGPDSVWLAFSSPDAFGQYLATLPAGAPPDQSVRPLRIDARQEGDVAAAWAETRRGDAARSLAGSTDHFVLRRIGGSWLITAFTASLAPTAGIR